MINQIRSGREIQEEINDLQLLKIKLAKVDLGEKYNLLITEIDSILNTLNWVGQVKQFPTPSKHIKDFVYRKTQILL